MTNYIKFLYYFLNGWTIVSQPIRVKNLIKWPKLNGSNICIGGCYCFFVFVFFQGQPHTKGKK